MAQKMVVDGALLDQQLTALAQSIRSKGGTRETFASADQMRLAVEALQSDPAPVRQACLEQLTQGLWPAGNLQFDSILFAEGCLAYAPAIETVTVTGNCTLRSRCFEASGLTAFTSETACMISGQNNFSRSQLQKLVLKKRVQRDTEGDTLAQNCTSLTTVDLTVTRFDLRRADFAGCTGLNTLILRGNFAALTNATALLNTAIDKGAGWIYVPKNMKARYERDTGWSKYKSRLRVLESFPAVTGG